MNEGFLIDVVRFEEKIQKAYNEDDNLAHKATQRGTLISHWSIL